MKRPALYANAHLRRVGPNIAERDTNACMQRAEAYLSSERADTEVAKEAAVGAGTGAAIGAAAGAASGAVVGSAARGAAAGAAGGGAAALTGSLLRGLFRPREPDPAYKSFVNRCLREKGYDLIGWN